MTNFNHAAVGALIRDRRKALRLTQERLSELADISASFLGHIERGTRKASIETIVRIAEALDVCVCAFIPQMRHTDSANFYEQLVEDILKLILSRTGEERS